MAKKSKQTKVNAEETPEQRFQRLAVQRVNAAIKKISLIGNLGGNGYKSTVEQQDKIIDTLRNAVELVRKRFVKDNPVETFTL